MCHFYAATSISGLIDFMSDRVLREFDTLIIFMSIKNMLKGIKSDLHAYSLLIWKLIPGIFCQNLVFSKYIVTHFSS